MSTHETVLLNEAVDLLVTNKSGAYLDCTGGLGGHSRAILDRLGPDGRLWICDYHTETAKALSSEFATDKRVTVVTARFSAIFDNLNFSSLGFFDGILADFGISSPQLENQALGIGFQINGAHLDMRIDRGLSVTAADILKTETEESLADIFFYLGGERAARRLSRAIVADRNEGIFYETTDALRDLCARVIGKFYRGKKIHPATKVFQALRIKVNHELDEVAALLSAAPQRLTPGGRLVLIAFHEGEDRLVKTRFRELAMTDDFTLPVRKAIKPGENEIKQNPRARSAKMRVLERIKEVE